MRFWSFGFSVLLCRFAFMLSALLPIMALPALSQDGAERDQSFIYDTPLRTESPRDTFATFLRLSDEMEEALADYMTEPSFAGVNRLALLSDQMNALLDLDGVAASSRREVGIRTWTYLMDIFRRIPPPDLDDLPYVNQLETAGTNTVRITNTPIYITRMEEGDRRSEYLFAANTVEAAPRFFRAVRSEPMRTTLDIESFTELGPQITGPLFPPHVVNAIPPSLLVLWLDTPIWKAIAMFASLIAFAAIVVWVDKIRAAIGPKSRLGRLIAQAALPVTLLMITSIALPFVTFQVNVSGRFAHIVAGVQTILSFLAYAWIFWIFVRGLFEAVILSPRIPDESLDANMLRLLSNVVGGIGVVAILAFGGQAIGLPIVSILAGLGIGGLAVALALQPTLANLLAGVMLYADRPVRVGDFCSFGEHMGTIEGIGLRSTKVRALNRTLISVPNAQFADMQIVNFAYCDQMLVHETIGVRYETTSEQLRYLLARLRQMLHAHPRVDPGTVRVRFAGYGENALKIDMRIYVATREWNDFFAVREDIFLRINDIVVEAGTGFAFPSRTLYVRRDPGLDADRADAAASEVQGWRDLGKLPFPRMTPEDIERLGGTLDYPPRGSADTETEDAAAEPLSTREDTPDAAKETNEDDRNRPAPRG
jgi:MscS family membrane protein